MSFALCKEPQNNDPSLVMKSKNTKTNDNANKKRNLRKLNVENEKMETPREKLGLFRNFKFLILSVLPDREIITKT